MRIGSNKGSEVEAYTDFIKEAEGLKSTLRTAWTAEGRQESTAEHSWRLALFAGVMCREFPELDREKVLMMCLVHDLGERYSGDISAALRPDAGDKLKGRCTADMRFFAKRRGRGGVRAVGGIQSGHYPGSQICKSPG